MNAPNVQPTASHSLSTKVGSAYGGKVYRRITTLFLLLTVGVIGLVAYVVLSRASVVVMSAQQTVDSDFIVDVAKAPGDEEVAGDILEMKDTLMQQFPAASLAKVESHAEGRVKISTTLSRAQTLVATTRLLTPDQVLFRIKKTITVPANGSVEVDAFSDLPGTVGDIGHAIFTIPGLDPSVRQYFKVETVTPMAGGLKEVRMVTKEDVKEAAAVIHEKLEKELASKLRADAGAFSGEFITSEIVSQATDVPVGSEAENFSLTLTVKTLGVFYDKKAFDGTVETRIKEVVPFDRTLLRIDDAAVARTVEKTDVPGGRANIRVKAKGVTIISAKSPSLDPAKLTGITVGAAQTYLEKIEGVSSASVRVSPFWASRTPNIAKNIKIEVR